MAAMDTTEIPASVTAQVAAIIGPFQVTCNYRVQGARTSVWKIEAKSQSYILKLHHKKRKWHPEVHAYAQWAGAYAPYAPTLVSIIENEETQGILTTEIRGIPLRQAQVADEKKAEVYYQAGRLAGQLHRTQPGEWFGIPDSQGAPLHERFDDPVITMKADFDKWWTKAMTLQCLDRSEIALAEWALDHMHAYAGERPLPINQDYTPGNWLVDEQGRLAGVIDFECMLWGVRVNSFALLWDRYFPQNPLFETAFWEGYGVDLVQACPAQVFIVCTQIGIADIAVGTEFKNEQAVLSGRQLLRRVMDKLSNGL